VGGKEVIMSMHKEEVLELVRQLPDEVDVEEVIYRLYLREKLAAAEADIAAGRTLSHEEVREQARTWRP
jgi:predicted transcriptional regulator